VDGLSVPRFRSWWNLFDALHWGAHDFSTIETTRIGTNIIDSKTADYFRPE